MASEIKMPQFGLTMTEGVIAQWLKKEGDPVKPGDPLYVVETDKLTNEVEAEVEGVLLKIVQPEGAEVPVQGVIAIVGAAGETVESAPAAAAASTVPAAPVADTAPTAGEDMSKAGPGSTASPAGGRIKASPLAKKIAAREGVDLTAVTGTGPGGRIVEKDVRVAASGQTGGVPRQARSAPEAAPAPKADAVVVTGQPVRRQRLSAMRRAIARNMTASWTTAPVVGYNRSVDVTALGELKKTLSTDGRKISYTDILCKLVTNVLQDFPYVNSSLDGDDVIFHDYVNLGVAVALDDGLVVPVIRDAQSKGIGAISDAVRDMAKRARSGELTPDELSGGTFTITNLGMFGMESFSPIINQPESAILGVNTIVKQPVEMPDGSIVMRPKMNLSLTADHRTVDGAVAAQFLARVATLIENPWQMLL
ncbi:MAG: 2-oxo acid dehydrogenase subunit E2 [Planctomycetes bacterium]|nr:2-oxo acid dehydrogenase subunit E2 [Planctomycetota bacterium]